MHISHRIAALALASICNTAQALDANEEITASDMGFQYLVYAVTWQPSFCRLKPETAGCDHPPADFLTHGIWPYNNSTRTKTNRHPAFCKTAPDGLPGSPREKHDGTLESMMGRRELSELLAADPRGMLEHEWKKHGTCSGKTEAEYFNAFVDLRKVVTYDVSAFNAWIGGRVMFDNIKAAFPPHTAFRCFVQNGEQYLHEVFYLITPNGAPYIEDGTLQIGTPCHSQETIIPKGVN